MSTQNSVTNNIQRFVIRKVQQQFAIVVSIPNRELTIDSGDQKTIKEIFIGYVNNRDSLNKRVQECIF